MIVFSGSILAYRMIGLGYKCSNCLDNPTMRLLQCVYQAGVGDNGHFWFSLAVRSLLSQLMKGKTHPPHPPGETLCGGRA